MIGPDTHMRHQAGQDSFRNVISHFATGVAVVNASVEGDDYATVASALSSLSFTPPLIFICLARRSDTCEAIIATGRFAVDILAEGQEHLARRYAFQAGGGGERVPLERSLARELIGSLAHLECSVVETASGRSDTVFLGDVERASARDGSPLTCFRGRFGGFARHRS
jgi:4-nitrophenol 2-monooxygenase / 4-nitrocatechol 4-monooxygenase, reductase component